MDRVQKPSDSESTELVSYVEKYVQVISLSAPPDDLPYLGDVRWVLWITVQL
jgi:hypothetical protein